MQCAELTVWAPGRVRRSKPFWPAAVAGGRPSMTASYSVGPLLMLPNKRRRPGASSRVP